MTDEIRIAGLDHIVLSVADVERSLKFYCDKLGLVALRLEEWRRGEVGFPSVRLNDQTIIDLSARPRTGENLRHFCLLIEPTDLDAVIESERFEVESGPVVAFGAQGNGHSIYVRDPDSNLIELKYYD